MGTSHRVVLTGPQEVGEKLFVSSTTGFLEPCILTDAFDSY